MYWIRESAGGEVRRRSSQFGSVDFANEYNLLFKRVSTNNTDAMSFVWACISICKTNSLSSQVEKHYYATNVITKWNETLFLGFKTLWTLETKIEK